MKSLYTRLYVWFLGILVASLALLLLLAALAVRLPGIFPPRVWVSVTHHMADEFSLALGTPLLQQRVDRLGATFGAHISVVSLEGRTLLARHGEALPEPDEQTVAAAHEGPVALMRWPLSMLAVVRVDGEPRALVQMSGSIWMEAPPWRLMLALLGTVLLSMVVWVPVTRRITRPLRQLSAVAESFGQGHLSARSGIQAQDEVGELARRFDAMAERIETARRAEKELLANVSHELRMPVARMKMALELVEVEDAEVLRRLREIDEELDELQALISDVLTANRLDLGAFPLQIKDVPLMLLMERSARRLQQVAPERQVQLVLEEGLVMRGDEKLLQRVVDNLLDNAHKYDPSQSPIRVEARAAAGWVHLTVVDRGRGISPEEAARIFEPFYRSRQVRSSTPGYGLGLALVSRIVRAHGGALHARPEPEGGTRMELTLPRAA